MLTINIKINQKNWIKKRIKRMGNTMIPLKDINKKTLAEFNILPGLEWSIIIFD